MFSAYTSCAWLAGFASLLSSCEASLLPDLCPDQSHGSGITLVQTLAHTRRQSTNELRSDRKLGSDLRLPRSSQIAIEPMTQVNQGCFPCSGLKSTLWMQPEDQAGDPSKNICIQGKAFPNLFLLGSKKSGTTSLASNLVSAGAECFDGWKESQFFRGKVLYQTPDEVKDTVASMSSPCDKHRRKIVADMTPDYFGMVPISDENHGKDNTLGESDVDLPHMLVDVYGSEARKLTFVLLLRDPLERLYSNFNMGDRALKNTYSDLTFSEYMDALVHSPELLGSYEKKLFWLSNYGRQMKHWLKYFHGRQFIVIPSSIFFANSTVVCEEISKIALMPIDCVPRPSELGPNDVGTDRMIKACSIKVDSSTSCQAYSSNRDSNLTENLRSAGAAQKEWCATAEAQGRCANTCCLHGFVEADEGDQTSCVNCHKPHKRDSVEEVTTRRQRRNWAILTSKDQSLLVNALATAGRAGAVLMGFQTYGLSEPRMPVFNESLILKWLRSSFNSW